MPCAGVRLRIVEADDRTREKRGASSLLSGIKTTWAVAFPTVEGGKATYPPDGGGAAYSFADCSRETGTVGCEFACGKLNLQPRPAGLGGRFGGG